jgi:hypothetical protein
MGATGWGLVELVARLLSPNEREAVLGDLAEAHQNVLRSLFDVLGLFFRRQGVCGVIGGDVWLALAWRCPVLTC